MRLKVQTDGLKELRQALAQLDSPVKFAQAVAPAMPQISRVIDTEATRRATHGYGGTVASTRQMAKAERSNTYKANKSSVTVKIGGAAAGPDGAWAVGAQMGSNRFKQFPVARKGGFTVFPAVRDRKEEIASLFLRELERVLS